MGPRHLCCITSITSTLRPTEQLKQPHSLFVTVASSGTPPKSKVLKREIDTSPAQISSLTSNYRSSSLSVLYARGVHNPTLPALQPVPVQQRPVHLRYSRFINDLPSLGCSPPCWLPTSTVLPNPQIFQPFLLPSLLFVLPPSSPYSHFSPSMTGIVQLLPDDLNLAGGSSSLRPLDFSNLLSYNNDPSLLSSAAISPAAPGWPILVSPLCSARLRLASDSLANDPNAWFAGLSPVCKSSPKVPQVFSDAEISAVTDAFWPVTTEQEPPFKTNQSLHTQSAFTASQSAVTTQITQSAFSSQQQTQSQTTVPCSTLDTVLGFTEAPIHPNKSAPQEPPAPSPMAHTTATGSPASAAVPAVASSSATGKLERKSGITRKMSQTLSSIDKAAERRRKNRESSSRCYYNRKRIIETLDKQISAEKTKLTNLYDRALELRHENARLKKDVVTQGIALPTKTKPYRSDSAFQLRGYFQLLQSASYQPQPARQ